MSPNDPYRSSASDVSLRRIWTALYPGSHAVWVAAGHGGLRKGEVMSSSSFAPKPLQVAAAVVGNALEWYDFIVFGFFAVIISRLFFPAESQCASLLLTTATFGVGFFMRRDWCRGAAAHRAGAPVAGLFRRRRVCQRHRLPSKALRRIGAVSMAPGK